MHAWRYLLSNRHRESGGAVFSKPFFTSKPPPERLVQCYHCRSHICVPATARTASCPACYKGLVLDDLCVREGHAAGRLSTCGKVVVEKRGRAVTRAVEAAAGVEVSGTLEARVLSGGPVHIRKGAHLKGECQATSIIVEPGAVIDRAFFRIGPDVFAQAHAGDVAGATSVAGVAGGGASSSMTSKPSQPLIEIRVKPLPPSNPFTLSAHPPTIREMQQEAMAATRQTANASQSISGSTPILKQATPVMPVMPVMPVPVPVPVPAPVAPGSPPQPAAAMHTTHAPTRDLVERSSIRRGCRREADPQPGTPITTSLRDEPAAASVSPARAATCVECVTRAARSRPFHARAHPSRPHLPRVTSGARAAARRPAARPGAPRAP